MKKLNKKQKLIILIAFITVIIIIGVVICTNAIENNISSGKYNSSNSGSNNGNLLPEYIKKGITLGGVTGTLESLNTFDATATAEDIAWGETAYVKGEKITGTKIITVAHAKEAQKVFKKNTVLLDEYGNRVNVPAGFKIAYDSATAVEDGVVIEDNEGNQFVWIPAKTGEGATIKLSTGGTATIVYKRTDFGYQHQSYSDYFESMPSDEEVSVNTWGGYFIGRYEAGDKESTENKKMRSTFTDATVTIKKDQAPYDFITPSNAKIKAEEMASVQNYENAFTKIVSSYAWDTAICFIQIKNSDYGTNSPEGNYLNSDLFTYTDIAGNEQIGPTNSLIPTGQTIAVSNIYDMGGNLWEYTTENCSLEGYPYVYRGGFYGYDYDYSPAGYRDHIGGTAVSFHGFRITLYCS